MSGTLGCTNCCTAAQSACRTEWRSRLNRRAVRHIEASESVAAQTPECMMGTSLNWMIVRNFISVEERARLLIKANKHMDSEELKANPCGPGRYFAKADDAPEVYVDALLEQLTRRCERCLRLGNVPSDCVLGRTLSLILPGGFVHPHTDAYQLGRPGHRPGLEHLRCNLVVRLANPSGRPVIEGHALPVEEGDLWVFFASKCMHETKPLQGSDARIVFGFGWSVPPDHRLMQPPTGWRDERPSEQDNVPAC
jgi:hypothetical protein